MKKLQDLRTQIAAYLYGISPPDNPQVKEIRPGAPRNWAVSWGQGRWNGFDSIAVGDLRSLLQTTGNEDCLFLGEVIWHTRDSTLGLQLRCMVMVPQVGTHSNLAAILTVEVNL